MRRLCVILAIVCCAACAKADVRYLLAEHPVVPDETVNALEVRVALDDARIGNPRCEQWCVRWGDVSVSVTFDFRNFVDGVDEPKVKIACNGVVGSLDKGFNSAGGYNTLALEWEPAGQVTVLFGERELYPVMVLDSLPRPVGELQIESTTGRLAVSDVMVDVDANNFSRLMTGYSAEELAAATQLRYLDRNSDPQLARLGGRYVLAWVGDDLVYMDGAQINETRWQQGMLKGRLKPTGYVGYYHLEWFDSTGRRLADDCYAELDEKAKTVTLVFPSLNASLRFAYGE